VDSYITHATAICKGVEFIPDWKTYLQMRQGEYMPNTGPIKTKRILSGFVDPLVALLKDMGVGKLGVNALNDEVHLSFWPLISNYYEPGELLANSDVNINMDTRGIICVGFLYVEQNLKDIPEISVWYRDKKRESEEQLYDLEDWSIALTHFFNLRKYNLLNPDR